MFGFWIFMLFMDLLIPLLMVGLGKLLAKHPPKRINGVSGYRTKRSMKTQETWEFAHRYFGNLWFRLGLVLIPLSVLPLIFVYGKDIELIGIVGAVVTLFEIVPMIVPVFPTERALKENFDEYGKPL